MITVRERLRFLFIGNSLKLPIDAILPVILLPILFGIAAIGFDYTIIVCVIVPLLLGYAHFWRKRYAPRTNFFFMWGIWSMIYLWIIFDITVPLFELLPEENLIFKLSMCFTIVCFYKVKVIDKSAICQYFYYVEFI